MTQQEGDTTQDLSTIEGVLRRYALFCEDHYYGGMAQAYAAAQDALQAVARLRQRLAVCDGL